MTHAQIDFYAAQLMQLEARKRFGVFTSRKPLHTCNPYTIVDADLCVDETMIGSLLKHGQAVMTSAILTHCMRSCNEGQFHFSMLSLSIRM